MKIKILEFLLQNKEKGTTYSSLITLDRYLVNVKGEQEYVGSFLVNKMNEIEKQNLVIQNDNDKYAITQKGINYLSKNSEE
ncbi:hypothetical protein [Psychroserpens luteolus]|uniref:hypothetical protein n=1 Tax=Psychroserpens luteolus TaxID=2855840 RepID=UPI001E632F4C|nr:hypothetical protein [Psychroserpens luteolus]MCD2258293.1 hypothetical protein [Psychroserpens luteolus]